MILVKRISADNFNEDSYEKTYTGLFEMKQGCIVSV